MLTIERQVTAGEADEPFDLRAFIEWMRPAWMARAECRDRPDVNWFPHRTESVRLAIAICRTCPVVRQCGEYVKGQGTGISGVWGGMSHKQRRQMRGSYDNR
jgi:WhiB family redox-sensing transcriptional regulator